MNKSDSERIASLLEKMGYKKAQKINEAGVIVVNMCSVRQTAVDRVYGLAQKLKKIKKENPRTKTILTGCILAKDKKIFDQRFDFVLEIKKLANWQKIISPRKKVLFRTNDYFKIPPKYQNKDTAFIPISSGCNNFCTYCAVPYTRGPLICRSHKEILKEIKKAAKEGKKEIWLLGQNVNDYRSPADPKIDFAQLLRMIDKIKDDFKLYFTSPHPKNFSQELIEVLAQSKKFARYLNLPVQSGSNRILKKMNRNYTIKEYKKLVEKIREKIPDIYLSTDIIVGFPGETKKQFEETKKLLREINFDNGYIAKYSPRPGTFAFKKFKDKIPLEEKKKREKILRDIISKKRKEKEKKKIVVVLGPTAAGKSDLAVKLAKKFQGEIISADSRQVYKGMDIGTGKITKREMEGISHHLLDVASPKRRFTVSQYKKLAEKEIKKIFKKGKLPIICGGSAFYIQALSEGLVIPPVSPDWELRKKLEKKTNKELFAELKKIAPKRAKTIDRNNKRRLIRALEIAKKQGRVPPLKKEPLPYPFLFLGVKKSKEELKKLIEKRLEKRLKKGMIAEVKKLKKGGLSWKRLDEFGLEYRQISRYLQGKISKQEMTEKLKQDIINFAKRQMVWWKNDKRIHWINNYKEAEKLVKNFLENKKSGD